MLLQRYGLITGLACAILAAICFPHKGVMDAQLWNRPLSDIAIWLIFFRQGLSLQTGELLAGRAPLRLHAFVLSWNFILFPAANALLLFFLHPLIAEELKLGFYMLSVLPTTVASAIALTSASGGHTANALFSTVYSNLIAIVWVPTVSLLYLRFSGIPDFGIFEALTKLTLLVALPLFIGQLVRSIFPNLSATLCQKTVWFCPVIILWLVYIAFVHSLLSDSFTQLPAKQVILTITLSGVLLLLVSGLVTWSARWLRLERERRIAAFYCASQKSLATGLPLTATIFTGIGQETLLAVALWPLLAYHTLQLLLAAGILSYNRKQT